MHKGTASLQLFQICFQFQQTFPPCHVHYLLPDCFQMLFHTFSPAERIPSRAALQLCSIYKDRSMICFSLLLQTSNILVKQIFHGLCTPSRPEACQRCVVRYGLFFQKLHEVHTVPAGLFQLSAGIDPALVSVHHYLEQHSWGDLRFSAFGRIGAIQFPVVQFLKLGACQSDGCVLWQQNFVVQGKDQLTISLIYATLALLLVFSHKLIIKQKDEQATPFFRGDLLIFFIQLPCAILQQALFILSGSWGSRHTIPARRTQKP